MHILDEEFCKELIDIYTGKRFTYCIKSRPAYVFNKVLLYLSSSYDSPDKVDKARELIDALADWTHNPTESELCKILDVEEKISGYGMTSNAGEAIAAVTYCITHEIPSNVDVVDIEGEPFYKISFKNITINQRDAIVKAASCMNLK